MQEKVLSNARILIIAGQEADIRALRSILKRGGTNVTVRSTTDPKKTRASLAAFQPDLVIVDLILRVVDVIQDSLSPGRSIPILAFAGDSSMTVGPRELPDGVKDFLTKPFEATMVVDRITRLLAGRESAGVGAGELLIGLRADQDPAVDAVVRSQHREHDEAQLDLLRRLALVAEFRDDLTGQHPLRVGEHAAVLAWALGLPDDEAELVRRAAPLHDIGKIAVSEDILLKPTGLTRDEFEEMKSHTVIGARILSGSKLPVLKMAEQIALTHHENWDGTGYPLRLRGEAIPLIGRIVAVADAYDAFTHDRPYRKALSPKEAWEIMWEGAGTQWDETVLEAFAASGIGKRPEIGSTPPLHRRVLATSLRR